MVYQYYPWHSVHDSMLCRSLGTLSVQWMEGY